MCNFLKERFCNRLHVHPLNVTRLYPAGPPTSISYFNDSYQQLKNFILTLKEIKQFLKNKIKLEGDNRINIWFLEGRNLFFYLVTIQSLHFVRKSPAGPKLSQIQNDDNHIRRVGILHVSSSS